MKNIVLPMGIAVLTFASCAVSPDPTDGSSRLENPVGYVALTFDDGPFPWTDRLLGILADYEVTATFFVIGNHVRARPEQARRIFEAGHELANHSWSHVSLGNSDPDLIRRELVQTSDVIREITGLDTPFFRAPNLNYGANLTRVAGELGLAIIGSDAVGQDWNDISPALIAANVGNASGGSIILLHEMWSGDTLRTEQALPQIIRGLRQRGLEPVSLGELLEKTGRTLSPGTLYNRIN